MSLDNLIKQNKIKKIQSSEQEINAILSLTDRDIKMAEFVMSQDWDWAFSIAYNATLQASRAYMYSKGYRASSTHGHKNTFEFMSEVLDNEEKELIGFFDRMRPKRNKATYDVSGIITETEVKELFKKAKEYVGIIKEKLQK